MRILVVGSCGKKKLFNQNNGPDCTDLASFEDVLKWKNDSIPPRARARNLYIGNQSQQLVIGTDLLRQIEDVEVELYIISAGFGLVNETDILPSYDCSFSDMKKHQILERASMLRISHDFEELLSKKFELVYLALGKNYFQTLDIVWTKWSNTTFIGFDKRHSGRNVLALPCDHQIVSTLSKNGHKIHGVTGFKGDLLRIIAEFALQQTNPFDEVSSWTTPSNLIKLFKKLVTYSS